MDGKLGGTAHLKAFGSEAAPSRSMVFWFLFLIFFLYHGKYTQWAFMYLEKSLLGFKKQACLFLELNAWIIHLSKDLVVWF